jgi:uncharacterized surface protein with fasciclin (FAS1) repeats
MSNITEVVGKEVNMTTLNRGIIASGLNEFLKKGGPYTVFAPSDMAFGKMQAGALEDLLKPENKAKLTNLLKNHIVEGKLKFSELKNGDKLKTLDGKELSVTQSMGKTSINNSIIQNRDVESSNGTIHSLDKVLLN